MILIVGARSAGKREYAKTLGYSENDMSNDVFSDAKVIYDVQDAVDKAPEKSLELIPVLLNKQVVICNEVGSGVIPLSKHERESREATGRLTVLLAQTAERVVRIVCGIPMVIK